MKPGSGQRAALAAHLLVVVLGAFPLWSAHLFGWIPADEGYLNSAASRFAAGEVPHRDYVERFPGALPAWNAAARALFGESFAGPRRGLLLAALLLLLLLHGVARRSLPSLAAAVVALAASTWGVPRWFASNPTWYVLLFGLAGAAALWPGSGRPAGRRILLAGACGGVAFCFKQTAGAYVVAALFATLALASVERYREDEPRASVLDRVATVASAALLPAVLLFALARQPGLYYPLLLVAAPAAIALALAGRALRGCVAPGMLRRGSWLALGVVLGLTPLVLFYAAHGALVDAWRGIFVLQWGAAMRQMIPYLGIPLGPPLLKLSVWIGAGVLAGATPGPIRRFAPLLPIVYSAAAGAIAADGDPQASLVLAVRELLMFAPLGIVSTVATLTVRGVRLGAAGALALLTAALFGVVYPLGAFLYAYYVAPLTILSAAVLARRAYPVAIVVVAAVLALAAALGSPTGAKQSDGSARPDRTVVTLGGAGGNLKVPAEEGRAVSRIVEEIRRRVGSGEPIFCYPSDFGFYLLSDTVNPTRHLFVDYYADGEAFREILDTLERREVDVVVLRTYMPVANPYRDAFLAALNRRYRPAVHEPPFLLLERREGS